MFHGILLLASLLMIAMSLSMNNGDINSRGTNSAAAKMISTLIEETGKSIVLFSGINSEIISSSVHYLGLKVSVVVNDYRSISDFRNPRIEATILHLESLMEFERFFNKIHPDVFSYDGYFTIIYERLDESEMQAIFSKFWKIYIYNVNVLFTSKSSSNLVLMFTYMPFANGSCNNVDSVQINVFNATSTTWSTNVFFPKKFKQLNRCPIRFGFHEGEPRFIITTKNGLRTVSGVCIDIGILFGNKLNFTANFIEYARETGIIFGNKTATGLMKRVINNEVDVISTTLQMDRNDVLSATRAIYVDKLILVVPRPFTIPPMRKILLPFSSASWMSIGSFLILACSVVKVLHYASKGFHDYVFGRNIRSSLFNVWNIFLGGVQPVLPQESFARFLLIEFSIFTLIIRSLYVGRVFDILKRNEQTVKLTTIDDYIKYNFTFYIYDSMANSIQGTKIISSARYELIAGSEIPSYREKTVDSSFNGVVLHYMYPLLYHNLLNRGNFTFRMCKEVVFTNSFVFYFTKNFYLQSDFDELLHAFDAAGFIDKIMSKYLDRSLMNNVEEQLPSAFNYSNTQGMFELFYYGCFVAFVGFICEIIWGRVRGREIVRH